MSPHSGLSSLVKNDNRLSNFFIYLVKTMNGLFRIARTRLKKTTRFAASVVDIFSVGRHAF